MSEAEETVRNLVKGIARRVRNIKAADKAFRAEVEAYRAELQEHLEKKTKKEEKPKNYLLYCTNCEIWYEASRKDERCPQCGG